MYSRRVLQSTAEEMGVDEPREGNFAYPQIGDD